jgi:WD40 repeat protein
MFVLSGGWDGYLRLWEANTGNHITALQVSTKPVSACTVSPDGKQWLSGTLEGMLARWDALTHQQISTFLAHTRPISSIGFSFDGRTLATAAWDRTVILWSTAREREGRTLTGHSDIVAGCRFTPDGRALVSWSHDGTLRTWEVARPRPVSTLSGHTDRVLAAGVSPDNRWAVSGSRDGVLKLWDLVLAKEIASASLGAESRACAFLLDGKSVVSVDVQGLMRVYSVPDLQPQTELATQLPVQCGELSPSGAVMALGCSDGRVYMVAIEGFDSLPLIVTASQTTRRTQTAFQRLLGKSNLKQTFVCCCPVCRQNFELSGNEPSQEIPCPSCRRKLRVAGVVSLAQES